MARFQTMICLALSICTGLLLMTTRSSAQARVDPAVVRAVQSVELLEGLDAAARAALGEALRGKRLVLLGENGHGVSEFTRAKVELVKFLHADLGFDVVAFESGFYECDAAYASIDRTPVADTMRACLLSQFHHRELMPLFEYIQTTRASPRPLRLAGVDFQIQGASRARSKAFADALKSASPDDAHRLEQLDASFVGLNSGPVEAKIEWVRANGRQLKTLIDSAAEAGGPSTLRFALEGASELLRREIVRVDALDRQSPVPAAFYEIRDEWMARAALRLLDEAPDRKVAIWMHNDHARYGLFELGGQMIRATGQFLKAQRGREVYAIGLLMGGGSYANNSRREQTVIAPPPGGLEDTFARAVAGQGWLRLTGNVPREIATWGLLEHAYISRGSTVATMRPAREFDALLYFSRVTPPSFRLGI